MALQVINIRDKYNIVPIWCYNTVVNNFNHVLVFLNQLLFIANWPGGYSLSWREIEITVLLIMSVLVGTWVFLVIQREDKFLWIWGMLLNATIVLRVMLDFPDSR